MPLSDSNKLFYIQSNIDNSDWVVAPNGINVHLAHKSGNLDQLWRREDDPRGGFFLVHVNSGLCLDWTGGRGADVTLQPRDLANSHLLWSQVDTGNSCFLYAANWNQALNVFGNGPYNQDSRIGLWEGSGGYGNELWKIIPDPGDVRVDSITYDMSQANVNLNLPPALCVATAVDNRTGSVPLKTKVELLRTISTSRKFTTSESSSRALRIAMTFGATIGVSEVVQVSNQMAMETTTSTTTSLTQQNAQVTTASDKVTTAANVPPGGHYEYAVRVHYGSVSVPYKAKISRMLPTGTREISEISGTYTNVNMTTYDIVGNDITDGTRKALPVQALRESEHA